MNLKSASVTCTSRLKIQVDQISIDVVDHLDLRRSFASSTAALPAKGLTYVWCAGKREMIVAAILDFPPIKVIAGFTLMPSGPHR
jgi:hypothetical protein